MEYNSNVADDTAGLGAVPGNRVIFGDPDQPPIIIGEGSLRIDFPVINAGGNEQIELDGLPDFTKKRPFKYKLKAGTLRAIETVGVLTQTATGVVTFTRYPLGSDTFPEALGCQLWVWLQRLKVTPANPFDFDPADLADQPQFVIRGGPFKLEVNKELVGPTPTHKSKGPHRYSHPGLDRFFRIGRWQIVDGEGFNVVTGENSDNSYRLFVTFHHR